MDSHFTEKQRNLSPHQISSEWINFALDGHEKLYENLIPTKLNGLAVVNYL